jgi:purine-binding chemotaxis protein CheW
VETGFILGMAKVEGGVKILLDIDKVFGEKEIDFMEEAA